jgi:hypothetical protein
VNTVESAAENTADNANLRGLVSFG